MGKEPKVKRTYRLDQEDYDRLLEKAHKLGIDESECVRHIIHGSINNLNIGTDVISKICKVCTLCTKILEQCDMEEQQRRSLMKETEDLCGMKIS